MEEKPGYQKDIASIRELMERSSKFISLSGLSGILSGTFALIGAAAAYSFLSSDSGDLTLIKQLGTTALLVLGASLGCGYWLAARKSKRLGLKIWDATSKRLLINLAIPLIAGGVFILILIGRGEIELIAPCCLIFYGLALINASPGLYDEVRYLGYCEIILGLVAAKLIGYGLIFWAIGFGVLHIVYGAVMYKKYDA